MDHTPTCPDCGGHEFSIDISQNVTVAFEGDEHEVIDQPGGDLEWDDSSTATCIACNHEAPLGEMKGA